MNAPSLDLIVVGAGPAGLAAATAAARAGLKCLCLDKLAPGGVLINLTILHDYAPGGSGADLASRLTDAATEAGVELGFGEVTALSHDGPWTVETADGDRHVARAVLLATGLDKGRLGLPNEADYEGRGLSHCASCDGPLYAGQPVVVAGKDRWAAAEAHELEAMVGQVTVVDGLSERIVGLDGANGLDWVVVEADGVKRSIPAKAVFVYLDQMPAAEFVPDLLARDATGHIVVDEAGRCSAPLAFAAGDVRAGARTILAEAIADGERAASAAIAALKGK